MTDFFLALRTSIKEVGSEFLGTIVILLVCAVMSVILRLIYAAIFRRKK